MIRPGILSLELNEMKDRLQNEMAQVIVNQESEG